MVNSQSINIILDILNSQKNIDDHKDLHDQIISIRSRFNFFQQEKIAGRVFHNEGKVEIQQIIGSLLQLIEVFPQDVFYYHKNDHKNTTNRNTYKFFIFSIIIIFLIFFFIKSCKVHYNWNEKAAIEQPSQPQDNNNVILDLNTPSDNIPKIKTPNKDTNLVSLTLTNIEEVSRNPSVIELDNKITLPIARIDEAYKKGHENEMNILADACAYAITLRNNGTSKITINHLFVEPIEYNKIDPKLKKRENLPYEKKSVVYILIKPKTKIKYDEAFILVDGVKQIWGGNITILPKSNETIYLRINAEKEGIYKFNLGVKYYNDDSSKLESIYLIKDQSWAFLESN